MKKALLFSAVFLSTLAISRLNTLTIYGEEEEINFFLQDSEEFVAEQKEKIDIPESYTEDEDLDELFESEENDNDILDSSNSITEESEDSDLTYTEENQIFNDVDDRSEPTLTEDQSPIEEIKEVSLQAETKSVTYGATGNTEKVSQPILSGIDISNWQAGIDIKSLDADFIICKSSGGKDYSDPQFSLFAETVLSSGKLLGFYHFAQDKGHEGTAIEEATHFYSTVQNYIGRGIPVLDWEGSALSLGTGWANSFLDTFYNLSGVKPLLYISAYVSRSYDWKEVANSGYKLWVAQYAHTDPVYGHDSDPWRDSLGVGVFGEPVMHQYTSHGRIPGYSGDLDLDIFYGNTTTWNNLMKPDLSVTTLTMHRLYNPNSGEHLYTSDTNEKNVLSTIGWKYEGIGWLAPKTGSPVYRLYNPNSGDHHYTLDSNERDVLSKIGWKYEGVGWYSDTGKGVPLYRLFNPNEKVGTHHYTTDYSEYKYLITIGWKGEGIAWYGVLEKSGASGGTSQFGSLAVSASGENNGSNTLSSIKQEDKSTMYEKLKSSKIVNSKLILSNENQKESILII